MSADTRAALDQAIAEHFGQADGHTLTDWVVLAVTIAPDCEDGERYFGTTVREGQPSHATLGLLQRQTLCAQRDTLSLIGDDDD